MFIIYSSTHSFNYLLNIYQIVVTTPKYSVFLHKGM